MSASIAGTPNLRLVSKHADFNAALREIHRVPPQVTLIDGDSGANLRNIVRLKALLPNLQVLVAGTSATEVSVIEALLAGATGYVLKSAPIGELARALLEVSEIGVFLCHEAQKAAVGYFRSIAQERTRTRLTPREHEICLMLRTQTEKNIALAIGLSVGTVHSHVKSVYRKHGVHSREQLLRRLVQVFHR